MVHLCASFAADDHSADPWCVLLYLLAFSRATLFLSLIKDT